MELYRDLLTEIDVINMRIGNLEKEYEFWLKATVEPNGYNAFPLDTCLHRMQKICDQVEIYSTLLEEKEKVRKEIEQRMSEFEGLEYKVTYMRDVLHMTLPEIAADLGYSYIWIKQVSARARRKEHTSNILTS
jgi:DNA-directed RNA polymerase specialized sigma24 family protein